ncbi:MAG TPA: LLM class flavin-dependent oxidoreductase [Acidimicrobiia bacterium]|nr:LLM class flavin-dependent oxidoreductase [Acidimicrobiia bacterium]
MDISCAFPPGPDVVEHVRLAESLGYERAWLYDSPALYPDVWVALAQVAEHTDRIGLGPAVLIPSLRHVLTQATAIATLEGLAPGRTVAAVGTGFTGRMALGQRPLPWSEVEEYVRQLRALLRGEHVVVDGSVVQMIPPAEFLPDRPIGVPIIVAANGPKGLRVARELGDGVMTIGSGQPDFDWCSVLAFGTVLDEGEPPRSSRALEAAGPALTVVYHGMYEANPDVVDSLPGGPEWRAALEELPAAERHLTVHEDHLVRVTERDAPLLEGDTVAGFTWTGPAPALRERLSQLEASGGTEILYGPMGPDIPRELRTFAAMAGLE